MTVIAYRRGHKIFMIFLLKIGIMEMTPFKEQMIEKNVHIVVCHQRKKDMITV